MNVRPEAAELARVWLKKARGDLKTAEHTLTLSDTECPFETVCFHAHQCVEKSLKAFLTFHGIAFKKIHDLKELLPLCDRIEPLSGQLGSVASLSPYAVEIRYPEIEESIDRLKAQEAVSLAQKVYEAVQRRLSV